MSDQPQDGGHAYPTAGHPEYQTSDGMTMRQHYKAQALAGGLIAHLEAFKKDPKFSSEDILASTAGVIADAMIAEDQQHESKETKS